MTSWIMYNVICGEDLPISEDVLAPTDATAEQLDKIWDTQVDTISEAEYDASMIDYEIYTLVEQPGIRVWYVVNNQRGMAVERICTAILKE